MMGMKAKGAAKGKAGAGADAKATANVGMSKMAGKTKKAKAYVAAKPAKKAKASYGK